jgi:uncharacterized membrane protein YphA (DoxX/SURF4 family)
MLLRVVACSLAVYEGIAGGFRSIPHTVVMLQMIAVVCACLVLIGLATPFAAVALAMCEIWMVFSNMAQWPLAIALGGVALALAMLGPGSMSIDARRFGRKRIDYYS